MGRIRECHDALIERALSATILAAFHTVHGALGYGLPESVYRRALAMELGRRGVHAATGVPAEVRYEGEVVGVFRAEMLVESRIVLALKASRVLSAVDGLQLRHQMRASDLALGMLLHFGPRPAFRTFVGPSVPGDGVEPGRGGLATAPATPSSAPRPRPRRAAYPTP